MTKTVEIYFEDLNPESQEHLLMAFETSEDQENWDVFPLAVIEREVEDPVPYNSSYNSLELHDFLDKFT